MVDRIKLILKEKGLTSSVFADTIGVSRGTVSHILNGRNAPSMDTINKILKIFPDISPAWFVNGLGQMYKQKNVVIVQDSPPKPKEPDLFYQNQPVETPIQPIDTAIVQEENKYPLKIEVKTPEKTTEYVDIQKIDLPKITSKKIDKIIIFFNDKTFMTFISEE